ncbi:MAG: hypothetical protein ACRCUT_04200, partial [Spirochaetota bacterium]
MKIRYSLVILMLAFSAAAGVYSQEKAEQQPRRGRPDHVLDLSFSGYGADPLSQFSARLLLDDKIATLRNAPVRNMIRADILSPDIEKLPERLYLVSETVMA